MCSKFSITTLRSLVNYVVGGWAHEGGGVRGFLSPHMISKHGIQLYKCLSPTSNFHLKEFDHLSECEKVEPLFLLTCNFKIIIWPSFSYCSALVCKVDIVEENSLVLGQVLQFHILQIHTIVVPHMIPNKK